jgi:hypothetical protein
MVAVAKDPRALQHASEELRNNRGLVMAAIAVDSGVLQYASDDLRNDMEVMVFAVASNPYDAATGKTLELASPELRNNREFAMVAVATEPRALQYVSDELRNDPALIALAKLTNRSIT